MIQPSRSSVVRTAVLTTAALSALAIFSQGCGSAPDSPEATAASAAQVTASNVCSSAMKEVLSNCPGTSQQQWQSDENAGSAAVACVSCVGSIPGVLSVLGATLAAISCDDCLQGVQKADACAIALSHLSECDGACSHAKSGANVCGGPYGNDFYHCQGGYPTIEGACQTHQFCDPKQTFAFGTISPAQCADCDNDHGQAPKSSYKVNDGYCMGSSGNAPGWHQCVSTGNAGGGGTWRYLPQLNAQKNCHPAPPPPPPAPGCGCYAGNGAYCGSGMTSHASSAHCSYGFTPDANTLYDCQNGKFSTQTVCSAHGEICHYNPSGADSCVVATSTCGCYAGAGNYCGSSAIHGHPSGCTLPAVVTQNPNHLFSCGVFSSSWTDLGNCASGCNYNPSGADSCAPAGGGI